MKVRFAGSGMELEAAMTRSVELVDKSMLMAYLKEEFAYWSPCESNVTLAPYSVNPAGEPALDKRIGWCTHLLCIDGKAALFTDGPMEGVPLPVDYKPLLVRY